MIGWVCGPIAQLDAVADAGVAGPPDADDAAVLDADVGLDRADDGVEDEGAGDDGVELRMATRGPGSTAAGSSWRSPRWARRRGAWRSSVDADPQVGVAEADPVAGRRAVAGEALGGGEAAHRTRTRRTVRVSPGAQRSVEPAVEVEPEAGGRRSIELEPRVDPLERVVAGDADDAPVEVFRTSMLGCARDGRRPRRSSGGLADRPGRVVAGRAERLAQDDEPGAVVHQHLEPDLVDEGGHAGEHLVGGRPPRVPPPRPPAYVAPARAASSIASQMSATASGALRSRPRSPVTPGQLRRREDEEPLLLPGRQPHGRHRSGGPGRQADRADRGPGPKVCRATHSLTVNGCAVKASGNRWKRLLGSGRSARANIRSAGGLRRLLGDVSPGNRLLLANSDPFGKRLDGLPGPAAASSVGRLCGWLGRPGRRRLRGTMRNRTGVRSFVGMRGFDRAQIPESASRGCCSGLVNQAAKRSTWQPPVDSRPRCLGSKVSVEATSASRVVEASCSGAAIRTSVT